MVYVDRGRVIIWRLPTTPGVGQTSDPDKYANNEAPPDDEDDDDFYLYEQDDFYVYDNSHPDNVQEVTARSDQRSRRAIV